MRVELVDRHRVLARLGEREAIREDPLAVDVGDGGRERPPVLGRLRAAVVALGGEVVERLEGHLVVHVDHHLQLAHRDAQVGLVELVRDVPAERAVLAPLLQPRVQEAEDEELRAQRVLLAAPAEELGVGDRVGEVRAEDVGAQALGGSLVILTPFWRTSTGKAATGRGEPKKSCWRRSWGPSPRRAFERHHPADEEVTVLEHDPVALLGPP